MKPLVSLTNPAIIRAYQSPYDKDFTALECWEMGGIGISDPSQGLQYQIWHMQVEGSGAGTSVWIDAPNTPSIQQIALPNITWARLSFDQNMHPIIAYVYQGGPGFWWWDPTIPGDTFTALPSTVISPCVTMDDKRDIQTRLGNNDVVMCYINGANLCYRLQRERYGTEHVWLTGVSSIVTNPFVNKIGLTENFRLQIEIRGALYL